MADLRFVGKNNQKKTVSAFASEVISTSGTMNDTLFTLPKGAIVTTCYAVTLTPSGVAGSGVAVKVGGTQVGNDIPVDAIATQSNGGQGVYFPTGGTVTVEVGVTAPDNAGRIRVVVDYIELNLTNGQYTD